MNKLIENIACWIIATAIALIVLDFLVVEPLLNYFTK